MSEASTPESTTEILGVADAKRRFSELIDRVHAGERFLISRRGRPAMALVPPGDPSAQRPGKHPLGLLVLVGALAETDFDVDAMVKDIYEARRNSKDRPVPELE